MSNKTRQVIFFILVVLLITTNVGCGGSGAVRSGSAVYYDMHYRNPWHGHPGAIPPPHYMGPPPVFIPPDVPSMPDMPPPEAAPLPM